MLLKLRRITAVLTAALTLAAASIPTNAEAQGFLTAALTLAATSIPTSAGAQGFYGPA